MACEAGIYNLAAIHLGDDYASTYLDNLDLVGKWVVVPQLICGTELKLNGPAINSLRSLSKFRNALVHYKSSPFPKNEKDSQKTNDKDNRVIDATNNAFKTMVLLSLELNRTLGTIGFSLPPFEESVLSSKRRPPRIINIIRRCRETDRNNS